MWLWGTHILLKKSAGVTDHFHLWIKLVKTNQCAGMLIDCQHYYVYPHEVVVTTFNVQVLLLR